MPQPRSPGNYRLKIWQAGERGAERPKLQQSLQFHCEFLTVLTFLAVIRFYARS